MLTDWDGKPATHQDERNYVWLLAIVLFGYIVVPIINDCLQSVPGV